MVLPGRRIGGFSILDPEAPTIVKPYSNPAQPVPSIMQSAFCCNIGQGVLGDSGRTPGVQCWLFVLQRGRTVKEAAD